MVARWITSRSGLLVDVSMRVAFNAFRTGWPSPRRRTAGAESARHCRRTGKTWNSERRRTWVDLLPRVGTRPGTSVATHDVLPLLVVETKATCAGMVASDLASMFLRPHGVGVSLKDVLPGWLLARWMLAPDLLPALGGGGAATAS